MVTNGATGATGANGSTGAAGTNGTNGATGATGPATPGSPEGPVAPINPGSPEGPVGPTGPAPFLEVSAYNAYGTESNCEVPIGVRPAPKSTDTSRNSTPAPKMVAGIGFTEPILILNNP